MSKPPQFYVPGSSTPAGWQSVAPNSNAYDSYGQPGIDTSASGPQGGPHTGGGGAYRGGGGGSYRGTVPTGAQPVGGVPGGMGGPGAPGVGGFGSVPSMGSHPHSMGPGGGPSGGGPSVMNDPLFGAGAGLIQSGLGAYGQRLFGSGRDYVQSSMDKYFSPTDLQYYFQVNHQYVRNKLKLVLFPFLHRGHWTRIAEQVAGGLTYKPPRGDMNAPDLYIPLMAMLTYVLVGAWKAGFQHKFNPGMINALMTRGLLMWTVETLLLRGMLYALGTGDAPLLDILSYGGYPFVGVTVSLLGLIVMRPTFYPLYIWTCLSSAMFLVRTMKRVIFTETRQYDRDSLKHRYALLLLGAAQFPIAFWLCSV